MTIAIIIPARFASTRFPGKPLALLQGRAMIDHVYAKAKKASSHLPDVQLAVATDDDRIKDHCENQGMTVIMTDESCLTGSDRAMQAANIMGLGPDDIIINPQGDAPFMPVAAIRGVIDAFANPAVQVATPVKRLSWDELDTLRENKKTTPFSGTTAVIGEDGNAFWFSKNIMPALRKEAKMRTSDAYSPVRQHLGLYGYRKGVLEKFTALPEGKYEALEGLEQLRFIENNIPVTCVEIDSGIPVMTGIDSPEDMDRAQSIPLESL